MFYSECVPSEASFYVCFIRPKLSNLKGRFNISKTPRAWQYVFFILESTAKTKTYRKQEAFKKRKYFCIYTVHRKIVTREKLIVKGKTKPQDLVNLALWMISPRSWVLFATFFSAWPRGDTPGTSSAWWSRPAQWGTRSTSSRSWIWCLSWLRQIISWL